jgi:hypothetical protein
MELEDLKTIWSVSMEGTLVREQGERGETGHRREQNREQTDLQIRALLGRRSQGLAAKMKRNLFGELILVLCIYIPATLFYFFGFGGKLSGMGGALLLLLACFAGYYYRKNKLLNEMQCPDCAIRSNLHRQVAVLRKYVRFYTIAGTILVPVMAILPFYITSTQLPHAAGAVALVSITVLTYYTNVWAMNKLYGRHIKKMRALLEEMEAA